MLTVEKGSINIYDQCILLRQLWNITIPLSKYQNLQNDYNLLKEKCLKFEYELDWLKRQLFGQKSEKSIPNDEQTSLDLDVDSKEIEVQEEEINYKCTKVKKSEGHSRGIMPTHLPFEDEIIEPDEDITGLNKISEEVSWIYKYKSGSLIIKRIIKILLFTG